jgi:ElaB/YqjD/DUF883 family membrane-anchored ribosome-binding protein
MSNPFSTPNSLDPADGFAHSPSVSQAANDLRVAAGEKAREFVQTAEVKAAELKDKAAESVQHFKETAAERAQQFKASASDQWHESRVRAREIQLTAEDYIRENPTKCVLSALGVGFLIGLIVRR